MISVLCLHTQWINTWGCQAPPAAKAALIPPRKGHGASLLGQETTCCAQPNRCRFSGQLHEHVCAHMHPFRDLTARAVRRLNYASRKQREGNSPRQISQILTGLLWDVLVLILCAFTPGFPQQQLGAKCHEVSVLGWEVQSISGERQAAWISPQLRWGVRVLACRDAEQSKM